jgi:ABC-type ATPase involved in cell division
MGVVFQDFRLIPRKTVLENVGFLPRILGVDREGRKRLAYDALRRVSLAHRAAAFPPQLSGGEQQRVAIARAIINEPELLVADEPTGNLDPELSREILRLFLAINSRGTTVVVATHDRDTILRVGGRVLTLAGGRLTGDQVVIGSAPPPGLPDEPAGDQEDPTPQEVAAAEAGLAPSTGVAPSPLSAEEASTAGAWPAESPS